MKQLSRKVLPSLLSAALVAGSVFSQSAVSADKVRWKMQAAFGSNLPALGDNIPQVLKSLDKVTGGAIKVKYFEPGKLVPTLNITDAVKDGKIEAGYTFLGYDQGKIPSSTLFAAVPFGMEPWEYVAWWYEGGGQKLAEDVYHKNNIHPVLCGITGPETAGWFRKEINSLDDLKGLKIRFAGLGGQVMQEVGASVTVLPGAEIFQALEKGALDATEFSLPAVDQRLGFNKVAKYNYFPGWHQPFTAFHLVINKKKWDQVSEQGKATIDMACQAGIALNIAKSEAHQGRVIEELAQQGAESKTLPEPLLRELQKVSDQVLNQVASEDSDFKKVMEHQKAFSKSYQKWKQLGYLPRDF